MHMLFLNLDQNKLYESCEKNFRIIFILLSFLPGLNVLYGAENQSTGMDVNGSIVIAWQENTSAGTEIKASALPAGSPVWEPPVTLSISPSASRPILVVAADGTDTVAAAIWTEVIAETAHLYGAMRTSLADGWIASVLVSDGTEDVFGNYELILNSEGEIVATWSSFESGNPSIRSSTTVINISNNWGAPTTINL